MLPTEFRQLAFWFKRRSKIQVFKVAATVTILDFELERFYYLFFIYKIPDASYQVSSQLAFRFRRKTRISRWPLRRPSWISYRNDFSYFFYLLVTLMLPTKFRQKQKSDFQDGGHGGHLEFSIKTILAIFDLVVTLMLPTKFQVNWHFSSGEVKNRFPRWPPRRPFWISDQNDFSSR